jgi:hypothetical protein
MQTYFLKEFQFIPDHNTKSVEDQFNEWVKMKSKHVSFDDVFKIIQISTVIVPWTSGYLGRVIMYVLYEFE